MSMLLAVVLTASVALSACTQEEDPTATQVPATATPTAPPTAAPTATPAATATSAPPTEVPEPSGGGPTARKFTIGEGSQGLFKVDETLRGLDIVVALETQALSGDIDLGSGTANVEIDLHTLTSDQSRRDRYIREQMFPGQPITTVSFASLGEIPDSFFTSGEELTRDLTAVVNVNGVDADIPFNITARLDNGKELVVLGVAQFTWQEFGMSAPQSSIFSVRDDVTAEILLRATLAQ